MDAFEEKLSLLLRWFSRRAQSKQLTSAVARRCWRVLGVALLAYLALLAQLALLARVVHSAGAVCS